ncbi:NTP transferase domain-containing protein [Kineococcus sp. R8]|uniref:NTP transferase domain-containing protein n=1 Tax=Kineococcus siccus TaxID=2696567 RepID=UPI001412D19C|nr:NTP transferase domain-containing protein [Kineococcus siccus]
MTTADDVTVLVLAGGGGTRFAARRPGSDKLLAPVGATGSLATLLAALLATPPDPPEPGTGVRVVVVGPPRDLPAGVRQVREEPPGGGPLAGVAAGLALVDTDVVVLLGGDAPFAAGAVPRLLAALRAAGPDVDAVVGVDPSGRRQPLLSAHRTAAARRALGALPAVAGAPLRALLAGRVLAVEVSAEEALDVDTPEDLEAARAVLRRHGGPGAGAAGRT